MITWTLLPGGPAPAQDTLLELERAGSILILILGDEKEGWKIGAMAAEDDELASDMMMATMGKVEER